MTSRLAGRTVAALSGALLVAALAALVYHFAADTLPMMER